MEILSPANAKQFKEEGYFVIENFFTETQVTNLLNFYESFQFESKPELNTNIKFCDRTENLKISDFIKSQFEASIDKYFANYETGSGVFIMKGIGEKSISSLHQDCNVVDESKYTSLTIWCPLVDVDENNGCIQVIPGSHKWFSVLRSFNMPYYFIEFDLVKDKLKAVPLNKGSVVVFAHNLFHGSKPNYSNVFRPAASFSLITKHAQPIHYILNNKKVQVCIANEDFFFNKASLLLSGQTNIDVDIIEEFALEEKHILTKETVLAYLKKDSSILNKLKKFFN
jgi:hypothetical protein